MVAFTQVAFEYAYVLQISHKSAVGNKQMLAGKSCYRYYYISCNI